MSSIKLPSDIGPSFVDLETNYRVMARVTRWHDQVREWWESIVPPDE